jgi:hypothetical protein
MSERLRTQRTLNRFRLARDFTRQASQPDAGSAFAVSG